MESTTDKENDARLHENTAKLLPVETNNTPNSQVFRPILQEIESSSNERVLNEDFSTSVRQQDITFVDVEASTITQSFISSNASFDPLGSYSQSENIYVKCNDFSYSATIDEDLYYSMDYMPENQSNYSLSSVDGHLSYDKIDSSGKVENNSDSIPHPSITENVDASSLNATFEKMPNPKVSTSMNEISNAKSGTAEFSSVASQSKTEELNVINFKSDAIGEENAADVSEIQLKFNKSPEDAKLDLSGIANYDMDEVLNHSEDGSIYVESNRGSAIEKSPNAGLSCEDTVKGDEVKTEEKDIYDQILDFSDVNISYTESDEVGENSSMKGTLKVEKGGTNSGLLCQVKTEDVFYLFEVSNQYESSKEDDILNFSDRAGVGPETENINQNFSVPEIEEIVNLENPNLRGEIQIDGSFILDRSKSVKDDGKKTQVETILNSFMLEKGVVNPESTESHCKVELSNHSKSIKDDKLVNVPDVGIDHQHVGDDNICKQSEISESRFELNVAVEKQRTANTDVEFPIHVKLIEHTKEDKQQLQEDPKDLTIYETPDSLREERDLNGKHLSFSDGTKLEFVKLVEEQNSRNASIRFENDLKSIDHLEEDKQQLRDKTQELAGEKGDINDAILNFSDVDGKIFELNKLVDEENTMNTDIHFEIDVKPVDPSEEIKEQIQNGTTTCDKAAEPVAEKEVANNEHLNFSDVDGKRLVMSELVDDRNTVNTDVQFDNDVKSVDQTVEGKQPLQEDITTCDKTTESVEEKRFMNNELGSFSGAEGKKLEVSEPVTEQNTINTNVQFDNDVKSVDQSVEGKQPLQEDVTICDKTLQSVGEKGVVSNELLNFSAVDNKKLEFSEPVDEQNNMNTNVPFDDDVQFVDQSVESKQPLQEDVTICDKTLQSVGETEVVSNDLLNFSVVDGKKPELSEPVEEKKTVNTDIQFENYVKPVDQLVEDRQQEDATKGTSYVKTPEQASESFKEEETKAENTSSLMDKDKSAGLENPRNITIKVKRDSESENTLNKTETKPIVLEGSATSSDLELVSDNASNKTVEIVQENTSQALKIFKEKIPPKLQCRPSIRSTRQKTQVIVHPLIVKGHTEEKQATIETYREKEKQLTNELNKLEAELKATQNDNEMLDKQILANALAKEAQRDHILKYKSIVDKYQDCINKQSKDLVKMQMEKGQFEKEFSNMEMAFADIFKKYERSKSTIEVYKKNEETLNENIENVEKQISFINGKYKELQDRYEQTVKLAQDRINREVEANKEKLLSLRTNVKRLEIKASSLETALKQKTEECQALSSLYDDMTKM